MECFLLAWACWLALRSSSWRGSSLESFAVKCSPRFVPFDSSSAVSVSEAASLLGTSERTVRKWIARHNLETRRELRSGRNVLVLELEGLRAATAREVLVPSAPAHKPKQAAPVGSVDIEPLFVEREKLLAECQLLERNLEAARLELATARALLAASEKSEARLNAYADRLEERLEKERSDVRRLERLAGQLTGERDSLRERPSLWARLFRL